MDYKREYVKMRNAMKLDNNWLWNYYKSEGGKLSNPNEFLQIFYTTQEPIVMHGHNMGYTRVNRDLSTFLSDMDAKFGLQTLWNKDGDFIKVVE